MGLKEMVGDWVADKIIPAGTKIDMGFRWGILSEYFVARASIERSLVKKMNLTARYMSEAMRFTRLTPSDRFIVIAAATEQLCEHLVETSSEGSEDWEKNLQLRSLSGLFFKDSRIVENFVSCPNYYSDEDLVADMTEQMCIFCFENCVDPEWGKMLLEKFVGLYCFSDASNIVKDEMAKFLKENEGKYSGAGRYVKLYEKWRKDWTFLQNLSQNSLAVVKSAMVV